ncbi:MAG TPA: hypothetical protein VFI06_08385, partial [Chitinophagaceae bacterium]|nr:hypothetical protein [Chitinophagaceae bacterium]
MRKIRDVLLMLLIAGGGCGKNKQGGDVTPRLSFNDITMAEGNGGTNTLEVTLSLDQGSSKQITVVYSTIDGTAKGGLDF